MPIDFITGIFLAIFAALCINVGKAVQKQYVQVFTHGRDMFKTDHRRELYGWIFGLGITLSAMVPFSLALKLTESPSIVSSMTGVGLIGLAVYAVLVIGERFERADLVGVIFVVFGTSVLSWLSTGTAVEGREVLGWGMVRGIGPVLFACALLCALSFRYPKIWGISWGLASGTCIGTALILGDVALMEAGGSFFGQLKNPYPFIALLVSFPALVTTQIGFLRARALEVVPAVNSSTILAPLFLEYVMYGSIPGLFRFVMIGIIVIGVILLSMSTGARAAESKAEKLLAEESEEAALPGPDFAGSSGS